MKYSTTMIPAIKRTCQTLTGFFLKFMLRFPFVGRVIWIVYHIPAGETRAAAQISLRAFLKTKKSTNFPQATDRCKAKNAGILCGFRVFLTQQLALIVGKVYDFDFSDSPQEPVD